MAAVPPPVGRTTLAGSPPPGKPLFGNLSKHTNLMIQADLARVGIPYRDARERVADFHALRHSYVTALDKSNAPVKVVQTLARHSTPTLTLGLYAHVELADQTSALGALPDLATTAAQPERGSGSDVNGTRNSHSAFCIKRLRAL